MIKRKGLRQCIIEGDSVTVISWGMRSICGVWRLHHFTYDIRILSKELETDLHHIRRFQNSLADTIAKFGVGKPQMFEGDHMPG